MYLIEAAFWLVIAKVLLLFVPFRYWAPLLGDTKKNIQLAELDNSSRETLKHISRAIRSVANRLPWKCMCLERAMAARAMLRVRRFDTIFYLGVQKADKNLYRAHAWIQSGDVVLTGGEVAPEFTVVSTFSEAH